jgi:hypothetical protein
VNISYDGYYGFQKIAKKPELLNAKQYMEIMDRKDGAYGEDTSYQFLREYRPNTRSFAMVITTGTEYSNYLENVRHLNVLSDSIDNIPDEFAKSFKPC